MIMRLKNANGFGGYMTMDMFLDFFQIVIVTWPHNNTYILFYNSTFLAIENEFLLL
jgi:hypothetical protein